MMKTRINQNQSDTRDTQNVKGYSTGEKRKSKSKEKGVPKRFNQISVH